MIEVVIRNPATGLELAKIEIKSTAAGTTEYATYSVKFAVERGTAVGLHTRLIFGFPRKKYNVLALLKQALETLDPKELELERDYDIDSRETDRSADLARGIRGTRREV